MARDLGARRMGWSRTSALVCGSEISCQCLFFYGPREFAEADGMLPRAGFSYRSKGWEETVCSQLTVMIRCYQSDFRSSWCI